MLEPDFNKNHPGWKVAAMLVDRMHRIIYAVAALCAAWQAPAGAKWLVAVVARWWP